MLTRYQVESELSVAYLHAIAAKATFSVDIPHVDNDSVDATISGKGLLDPDSKLRSPKIDVQLKATVNWEINADKTIAYSLPIKNYNDLRVETLVPRILVLLCLPKDETHWLTHDPEFLTLKKCAHWLNLKNFPEVNGQDHKTVHLPEANVLTPAVLRELMIKVSKVQDL